MLETVTRLLFDEDDADVYECRRCGTTVDSEGATCPHCGSEEIASFSTE